MLTDSQLLQFLPQILQDMPADWRGTTFNNANLLGRQKFADNLTALIVGKLSSGEAITTADLSLVGNAEDYLRVSSNVSTTLELLLALQKKLPVAQVFSFASTKIPIVAVLLTAKAPVHLYTGAGEPPFTAEQLETLRFLGANLVSHTGPPQAHPSDVVLALECAWQPEIAVDGIIGCNVLYITNPDKIVPDDILVIRKRMATPLTTPAAEVLLQAACKMPITSIVDPSKDDLASFHAHLQVLSGTDPNPSANPVVCTAGLSALCAFFVAFIQRGGADVLMCSTAYGGSNQLTDLLNTWAPNFNKHTFDIQGDANIEESIQGQLKHLASQAATLHDTTVLFVEVPTNPDMKVPDVCKITGMLRAYEQESGKKVFLLVDTTFAPGSQVMRQVRELDADLPVLAFISLSKSISAGRTTSGTIVANHTPEAISVLHDVAAAANMLDTNAKPDQMQLLIQNHVGVEQRCEQAYQTAVSIGQALLAAVKGSTKEDMFLRFPTPAQASKGFTSATFSFNLPPFPGGSDDVNAALAQRFVDLLCAHKEFKPCVSFGQDNNTVYATVPATSTQGAIKLEHKAKQAVGGVQLVRLSFPPTCDVGSVSRIMADSVASLYSAQ